MSAAVIASILCLIILLRAIRNLYNLLRSLRWLSSNSLSRQKEDAGTRFIICIPALNEQNTIEATLDKFLDQEYSRSLYSVYVVTTSRERRNAARPSTAEVVEAYRGRLSKEKAKLINVVNYPKRDGRMAHQINYLAQRLTSSLTRENVYFVIYNADSHILPNTLSRTDAQIALAKKRTGRYPGLLQQSALYQYQGRDRIAEGAGLHQTLWTLMHEVPKIRSQSSGLERLGDSRRRLSILLYSRIAHCVGHGLFVHGRYYLDHPFSSDILNEDLPYGLQACAIRESILPIPSLELASTPARLSMVYRQKSVWFNPFFEFLSFGRQLSARRLYKSKFELGYLVVQAYIPLFIWLLHSIILLGGLLFCVLAGPWYVAMWCVAISVYWFIPAAIVTLYRRRLDNGGTNSFWSIGWGVVYVLSHSIGPIWSVMRWGRARLLHVAPDKPKTEAL